MVHINGLKKRVNVEVDMVTFPERRCLVNIYRRKSQVSKLCNSHKLYSKAVTFLTLEKSSCDYFCLIKFKKEKKGDGL